MKFLLAALCVLPTSAFYVGLPKAQRLSAVSLGSTRSRTGTSTTNRGIGIGAPRPTRTSFDNGESRQRGYIHPPSVDTGPLSRNEEALRRSSDRTGRSLDRTDGRSLDRTDGRSPYDNRYDSVETREASGPKRSRSSSVDGDPRQVCTYALQKVDKQ